MKPKRQNLLVSNTIILKSGFVALGLAGTLQAQTWDYGAATQAWTDAANWNPNGVPALGSGATVNYAVAGQTPIITTVVPRTGADTWIGNGATGILDISAGGSVNTSTKWIFVGNAAAGDGTLNVNSGGILTSDNSLRLGQAGGGGHLNVDGGTVTVNSIANVTPAKNTVRFSNAATVTTVGGTGLSGLTLTNLTGAVNLQGGNQSIAAGNSDIASGGTFTSSGELFVGNGVSSTLTVDAGAGSVSAGSWIPVGIGTGGNGTLNLNSGTINASNVSGTAFTTVGANNNAIGVINQNGGTYNQGGAGIVLGEGGTGSGTFNLNAGILNTKRIWNNAGTTSGALNLNGGTLRATATAADFISATVVTKIGAGKLATIDSNTFNITVASALGTAGGDSGLTKLSAGNLTLTGAASYVGPTLVSGGTLTLSGGNINSSSGITVNGSGAKLVLANNGTTSTPVVVTLGSLDADGTINTLSVANNVANTLTTGNGSAYPLYTNTLTFNGAATLNLQATGTSMTRYFDTTDLTTNAAGTIVVNASTTTGVWSSGTDYSVVNYSGTFTGDIAHFTKGTVTGLAPNQTATLIDEGGIFLRITGESLIWTGGQGDTWTTTPIGGSKNWSFDASGIEYANNDAVQFNDTATTTDVVLGENVAPSAILFDNSSSVYTLSGSFGITGSTTLVKTGTGTLSISTDNAYTGTTTITDGILEITGSGSISGSSAITVTDPGLLSLNISTADVYAHPINGTGDVAKDGAGTLTLSGVNTFTGDFTWTNGALNLNSATALGEGPGVFYVDGGGVIDNTSLAAVNMTSLKPQEWGVDITFTGTNSLNMGNGAVTLGASRTVNVANNTLAVGAVGDGAADYNLVKTGSGKLVLNGGNIGGNLDIQSGILGINQDFFGAAPTGTGILQNDGAVATKWTFWYGPADVTSNVLIRNNDGTNQTLLGIVKRGSGTLTLTNSSNVAEGNLSVDSGKIVLNAGTYGARNDDGTTTTNLTALVGNTAAANGSLEINGATVNYNNRSNVGVDPWRSTLSIGNNGTGAGVLKLTAGSLTTNKQLAVGSVSGAFGGYTQTGGTASVGGFLAIGLGTAQGVFNLSGGTYTMTAGPVTNGAGTGGRGVMNLSGNAIFNHDSPTANAIWIGENGTGSLTVSDSAALNVPNNGIEIGKINAAASIGRVNLLGGTVTTNSVSKPGAAATGVINFNGGTLAANIPNATFMAGLTNAYVRSGGGTINNGGNAITIGQPLIAPTGDGVSATGLTVSGGGYIDTPVVTIAGDGTGATAVATINATGDLTGITITSPGNNYTTATVTLSGGGIGNTGALGGAATVVTNTSGGMTFNGASITTLGGANTYTGNTKVDAGTLVVASTGSLKFAPTTNGVSNKVTGAGLVSVDGAFNLDLSNANVADGNTWTLVDSASPVYNLVTFNVTSDLGAFTESPSGVHKLTAGANTWTFTESSGLLTLSVSEGGSAYDAWASLNSVTQGATGDDENDGIQNLLEFALGGDPQASDMNKLPTQSVTATDFIFTFNRMDASKAEVALTFEYGSDLSGWTGVSIPASGSGVLPVSIDESGDPDVITVTIPKGINTELFGRLKAVK
ncbi:autotransporter-associated beta strand repeat-containing protein [bacterium]|nr:autotransporter-associated beta strand repeat-containing protein [bacterium]